MLRSFADKYFITVDNLSYNLPDNSTLFKNISFTLNRGDKAALIGNNGAGKSTLARIIAGKLQPSAGSMNTNASVYYLPQATLPMGGTAETLLDIKGKVRALKAIENGDSSEEHFSVIANDWDIREQIIKELAFWNVSHIGLDTSLSEISGGEKEKLLLAGAFLSGADIIIFDEPTNNLDLSSRRLFIKRMLESPAGVLVISHDRGLLDAISFIMELDRGVLTSYGGNYTFYLDEKEGRRQNLEQKQTTIQNELKKLKSTMVKDAEKAAHSEKVGKSQIAKGRFPRIIANARKGLSVSTLAKKKELSAAKIDKTEQDLRSVSAELVKYPIKIPVPANPFTRERLAELENITFAYGKRVIFEDFSLLVRGGERLAVSGDNGTGKTTLVKLIMGLLEPQKGTIKRNGIFVYLDQNLSIINPEKTVLENITSINGSLTVNEARIALANFNFRSEQAHKPANILSGGELLRCAMASILATEKHPDLIIMDEPTNNLDIQSLEILESALNQYRGGLIIISHDEIFLNNIGVDEEIVL